MATIAITGAGRGIGFELVKQYAEDGNRVFAFCRKPAEAKALADFAASHDTVTVIAMDVGSDESVKSAIAQLGDESIDVLLNVAGIVGPYTPELEQSDWDAWDEVLNIMLKGPLRVLQSVLPHMKAGSRVLNLSSQLAASTWPYGGFYAYGAAKAGLNRVMRSVAIDLKDRGIIVVLVHPGYVQTDMSGPSADITPTESAQGLRSVAESLTLEDSGKFLKWNGELHPW